MLKEMNIEQVEYSLKMMKAYQSDHPKAKVFLDLETQRVIITYALPKDYWEIERFGVNNPEEPLV